VKIVRRVPVKIIVDSGIDPTVGLPLGLSVDPTVHVQ
jgi:membrane fusion protein (multidrug efflux system)